MSGRTFYFVSGRLCNFKDREVRGGGPKGTLALPQAKGRHSVPVSKQVVEVLENSALNLPLN